MQFCVFALFIHPSIYTDGLYYCVGRCEAGFSVRNCVVFLAGTVRHACIGFPCGGRVKRATTPDAQPRCSTWQQHADSLHTSPHFSPFLSHCFLIQPKDKEKQHQSSIRCKKYNSNPIMNDAFPSETMKYMVGVWHSCLQEALVNICSLRHGCRSVKSCHLVTMSWKYWRKFQYPDHERGMIFSESPRWEQGGNHRDQNVTRLWGAAH